jgi:hypothetical protein
MRLDGRRLSNLRRRLAEAGDDEAAKAVDALGLTLHALDELAADDTLPRHVRIKAAKAWALCRWGSEVPSPFTPRDEIPVWGAIFDGG